MNDTASTPADAYVLDMLDDPAPALPADAPLPGFQAPKLSRYRPSERWADRWLRLRES